MQNLPRRADSTAADDADGGTDYETVDSAAWQTWLHVKRTGRLQAGSFLYCLAGKNDGKAKKMSLLELFLIAVGLSMDAFAVAVGKGLTMRRAGLKKMLAVGLYFGIFQAAMPLVGYFAGSLFAGFITSFDHWIAFALLVLIGGKMIYESFQKDEDEDCTEAALTPREMLPLAVATSIDALAVGVSFAFLKVDIVPAVLFIGFVTLVLSMAGVKIGNLFGARFKSKAEFAGGAILVLMGVKILLEHLGVIHF